MFKLLLLVCATFYGGALAHGSHGHHHDHHHAHHHGAENGTEGVEGDQTHPRGSFVEVLRTLPDGSSETVPLLIEQPEEFDPATVDTSNPTPDRFHPFNPRFEISRFEIDDDEWLQELGSEFQSGGLLPATLEDQRYFLLKAIPSGVVNINYAIHQCVHMGTQLVASEAVYPPTALSYPADENSLNTLVMIDPDNRNRLHWLIVNIPGSKLTEGQIVRGYNSPNPAPGTGSHRYVFLVMQQLGGRFDNVPNNPVDICKNDGRDNFNLELFKTRHYLSEPFAANFFTVEYDPFVENIPSVCHGPNTRQILQ